MGRSQQAKGRRGERLAREIVAACIYPNGEGTVVRSPRSGAWGGYKVLSGDLIPVFQDKVDYRWPFFWEVKNVQRSTFNPYRFLSGQMGPLEGWFKKAKSQALPKSVPVILWKVDNSDFQAFFGWDDYCKLSRLFGEFDPTVAQLLRPGYDEVFGFINVSAAEFVKWFKREAVIDGLIEFPDGKIND